MDSKNQKLVHALRGEFNDFVLNHEENYFEPMCEFLLGKCDFAGKRIFEFGCGTGELGIMLLERGAASLTGMDISQPATQAATAMAGKKAKGNARFICEDILETQAQFPPHDIVISHSVLHYIPGSLQPVLLKLREILAPGGIFFATVEAGEGISAVKLAQRANLILAPGFIKRRFHLLLKCILFFMGKQDITTQKSFKGKSRYLGIPTVQAKSAEGWAEEFRNAGFYPVTVEQLPALHSLSSPHYFITAVKAG